ncbi:hypothetical protein [Escherichia coli]|uniref:hypothetical protein n=1 Tax=Escherichia coli TaxID=562 RepID=UPI000DDA23F6|nr:hypothetical protein [Escherichia coli]
MYVEDDVVILSDWTQALSVYDSLNLDEIVSIYLRFGKKGRLNGFPIINIWQGGFYEEQIYYAMMYLLERALNELTLTKMREGESTVYHVNLKLPVENETSSIIGTKLYIAARNLLSLTQKVYGYQNTNYDLAIIDDCSSFYKDAILRLKKISAKYYKSEKYPLALFIGGFIFYAICAAIFLPEKYHTFESFFMIFICLLCMWGLARSTQKKDSDIKICKEDVEYLTLNVLLQHYFSKRNNLTGFISLADIDFILAQLDKNKE